MIGWRLPSPSWLARPFWEILDSPLVLCAICASENTAINISSVGPEFKCMTHVTGSVPFAPTTVTVERVLTVTVERLHESQIFVLEYHVISAPETNRKSEKNDLRLKQRN